MGDRQRRTYPQVEAVEARVVLSGGIAGAPVVGVVDSPGPVRSIHLEGTLHGHYRINSAIPDVGATYVTTGSGYVRGVGHAVATGELHSLGFVARGHAQGDLTLKGARGTIALHLTGVALQDGFQGLPSVFNFASTGGTGKDNGVHESGTATLVLSPGQGKAGGQGTFTLVLTPGPPPL